MKKSKLFFSMLSLGVCLGCTVAAQAQGNFYFPVGIAYASGEHEVYDRLVDNYLSDWQLSHPGSTITRVHREDVPIGLTLAPYYSLKCGLGFGLDLGPTMFAYGEFHHDDGYHYYNYDDSKFSYIIPVGAEIRYDFLPNYIVSPHLRVGVRYPITGGDDLTSSKPGPFGAIGYEFFHGRRLGGSFDVGYDASTVKVQGTESSKRVTFAGLTVGAAFRF